MSRVRQAAGGGRVVEVELARVPAWLNRFAGRNDGLADVVADPQRVLALAVDGTTASLAVPFPPMGLGPADAPLEPVEALIAHLERFRTVGVITVRSGAHSVGLARDIAREATVTGSSTDRAYVQGRTAAGGWSQQRYARRRTGQRREAMADTADTVARLLVPVARELDALVTAGDTSAVSEVLADRRLAPLLGLPRRHFADIPEPRRAVLDEVAARAGTVEITVVDPVR
ncbi:acVLRF1 family peptidyl-tRNA hydrolase [Nakamurella leprariae]|uniref:Actinobacteria/chloroflexi VLRF1 release factor domain-containing protein n=1 Tax=Nakamurella leprariae TaxID=2803911 RepID=A0A939BV53_9ACTN|nr:acVLRF1 family peptidyl-tRNA hydrolase [Nakamurella leprariae]MBM9466193.1 hypothetical protein [Nakamurella leprariae]